MIYSAADLAALWQAARLPAGLAVIGGGRWGKVWLQVIARARGDVRDVALVSRSHATDVNAWAAARTDMDGLRVVSTMSDAFAPYGLARIAIVATRPADHVRDALAALEEGAHVLVEKPLSHDAAEADRLVRAAQDRRLLLGIGTEFALLPAFHQGAAVLRERGHPPQRMELAWTDSNDEHRYGAAKAPHTEIGILDDLLPHAVSIFSVFAPDATLTIESALESAERTRGHLRFRGPYGLVCEIACDSRAAVRRRVLAVQAANTRVEIDFACARPVITIDRRACGPDPAFAPFDSTLRLELGAFIGEALHRTPNRTVITSNVAGLCALHQQLTALRDC